MSYETSTYSSLGHDKPIRPIEGISIMLTPEQSRVICGNVFDEFTELKNKHIDLLQHLANEVAEKQHYKDEAKHYKGLYESTLNTSSDEVQFDYFLDTRKWMNPETRLHPTKQQLRNLCNQLYNLSIKQYPNGNYYISHSKFTTPVYLLLSNESSLPFNFCGSLDDFAYFWNSNIYERQQQNNCKIKIECNADTLSTNKNRPPWKDVYHTSWKHLSLEGGKDASIYRQADDILKEIKTISF